MIAEVVSGVVAVCCFAGLLAYRYERPTRRRHGAAYRLERRLAHMHMIDGGLPDGDRGTS
jgi:hypothetical protein